MPRNKGPPYEEVICTSLGLLTIAAGNVINKRPLFARVYLYPLVGGLGYMIGQVIGDFNEKRIVDRELAIWDYVRRHPDDFPELTPKKYKDVLEPWHPVR